jgi:hypothetical protein
VAAAYLEGRECGDCNRCKAGACSENDPDLLCGSVCCQSTGKICVGAIFRECCAVERVTEEDGCCPANREVCGVASEPEHTYKECCEAGEQCLRGAGGKECCPHGRWCGDACCPEDHRCRDARKEECCRICLDGKCCPRGQQCVDTGFGGDTLCCDTPCGKRDDGTYSECCFPGQGCVDGACRPCPDGRAPCGQNLTCCPANQSCVRGQCKPDCPSGQVTATGQCCPDGRLACDGRCCGADELCCDGECVDPAFDPNHCGACGNACDQRTERCHEGQCRDRCSLNSTFTHACDEGGDYWCCRPEYATCCRDGDGDPHCCPT